MGISNDIVALLQDADEQLLIAGELHQEALETPAARDRFKTRIKNILENQRSALDYLAVAITNRYGAPKGLVYYPLAQSEKEFPSEMDTRMPGVALAEPKIADAIKAHQPYDGGNAWLRKLNQLTRQVKHNVLNPQIVQEVYSGRVTEKATGAVVQWRGGRFYPGLIQGPGAIDLWPGPDRDPALPKPFDIGAAGVLVFGVPIDPTTQRPSPSLALDIESGPLHQWCFLSPHEPVLDLLRLIQTSVRQTVDDIVQAARL